MRSVQARHQESVLALDEDCFLWKTMERWEFWFYCHDPVTLRGSCCIMVAPSRLHRLSSLCSHPGAPPKKNTLKYSIFFSFSLLAMWFSQLILMMLGF